MAHVFVFSWSEWVKGSAGHAPVLTGRWSAKSCMCIPRDHRVTHPKDSWSDSLRAREKDGEQEKTGRGWPKKESRGGGWLWCRQLGWSGALGTLHRATEPFTGCRVQVPLTWAPCGHSPGQHLWVDLQEVLLNQKTGARSGSANTPLGAWTGA